MKQTIYEIKLQAIYLILQYQKTKDIQHKTDAISLLQQILKYYHSKEKKVFKITLNEALIKFSGWIGGVDCVNILICSL